MRTEVLYEPKTKELSSSFDGVFMSLPPGLPAIDSPASLEGAIIRSAFGYPRLHIEDTLRAMAGLLDKTQASPQTAGWRNPTVRMLAEMQTIAQEEEHPVELRLGGVAMLFAGAQLYYRAGSPAPKGERQRGEQIKLAVDTVGSAAISLLHEYTRPYTRPKFKKSAASALPVTVAWNLLGEAPASVLLSGKATAKRLLFMADSLSGRVDKHTPDLRAVPNIEERLIPNTIVTNWISSPQEKQALLVQKWEQIQAFGIVRENASFSEVEMRYFTNSSKSGEDAFILCDLTNIARGVVKKTAQRTEEQGENDYLFERCARKILADLNGRSFAKVVNSPVSRVIFEVGRRGSGQPSRIFFSPLGNWRGARVFGIIGKTLTKEDEAAYLSAISGQEMTLSQVR